MNRTPSTELVGSRTRILPPDQILAFFTFAVVAAVTPGPSNVLVAAAGAHVGLWRGLHCLAGVVVGMALLMGVAVLGLGSLVAAYPWWTAALKWCGSAFLLWMAWRIATAPPMRTGSDPDRWASARPGVSVDQSQVLDRQRERGRHVRSRR